MPAIGAFLLVWQGIVVLLFAHSTGALVPVNSYEVVHEYPHSENFFTEGLIFDQESGRIYESTGGNYHCGLHRVILESGSIENTTNLCRGRGANGFMWFGEGLAQLNGLLYMLTWQAQTCFVINQTSFVRVSNMTFPGEGWGLTTDGTYLISSNGSAYISFHNPSTMNRERTIKVMRDGKPVYSLNELEYIQGEIWANVWHSTQVMRINPATGLVNSVVEFASIHPNILESVLNGIAYDSVQNRVFVTGKNWPKIFEVNVSGSAPTENSPITPPSLQPRVSSTPQEPQTSEAVLPSTSPEDHAAGRSSAHVHDEGGTSAGAIVLGIALGLGMLAIGIYLLLRAKGKYVDVRRQRGATEIEME